MHFMTSILTRAHGYNNIQAFFMALGYTLIPRYAAHLLCMEQSAVHMCEIIDPVHVVVAALAGWFEVRG